MHSLETRKQYWREFLKPGASPGFLYMVDCAEANARFLPPIPPRWPSKKAERIDAAAQRYEGFLKLAERIPDDRVPYLDNITGTEVFAEALGCRVERPADNMPFALPCVRSAREADRVKVPELSRSPLAYLFEIADELQRRAGPGAAQRLVDIQSPMDIAALVWEKESLFVAMLETPDAVHALAEKAHVLLTAFLDEWFRRYGTEYVAHWPEYFMSGGMTLSEDEIGAVGTDLFDAFFASHLARLSSRYGGIGLHCCADARHQWANLRAVPGLRLLNLGAPPARDMGAYVREAYPFFAGTCAQWHHGWTPPGDPAAWPDQVPAGARIVFNVTAPTLVEAQRLCDGLNAKRRGT